MSYTDILYDKSSGVASVTMNRPKVLNAFRTQTILEMSEALQDASSDRSVGVIVIGGAGERAFCVGGDISEMRDLTPEIGRAFLRRFADLLWRIRRAPAPVIAAVRGDHLDVIGHFNDPAPSPPHFDWLTSGTGFDRAHFEQVWREVAAFIAAAAR